MYNRPQKSESDEDLLKLQEDFIKHKADKTFQPAAKLANEVHVHAAQNSREETENEPPKLLSNTFDEIPTNITIGSIVEKSIKENQPSRSVRSQSKGFPVAKRRDVSAKPSHGSIFSQQMKRLKTDPKPTETTRAKIAKNVPAESFVLTGNEKHHIHKENVDVMSNMTEEEILEEREKLMSTMDPAIVAFLKSRRYHASKMATDNETDVEKQSKIVENVNVGDLSTVSDVLTQPRSERWLNFDRMEMTKLVWMKDVNVSAIKKNEGYEARFDFDGWLLPYEETEINEQNRTLYHHGDEPSRPGYTLQELFQLCRSNVVQQKITALKAIANLLSLETSGVYENVIDVPIEQVFFVLRFCLDDNTPAVVNASVKVMRNLIYYPVDEACLDSLLGFGLGSVQPSLQAEELDEEDDETVNDQQLAETNLVKCLARTGILVRIRYIINTIKPPIETIAYCLELLTRLARDSSRIASDVFRCENLVASVISNFAPKVFQQSPMNLNYGVPLRQAMKFLRVLATRSKIIAVELVDKYKIMESVLMNLSNEQFSANSNGIQLQTESLHLWSSLVCYGVAVDHFVIAQPVLMQMLHFHVQNTHLNIDTSYTIQGHVAALLNLIGVVAIQKFELVAPYVNVLMEQAVPKWTAQFASMNKFLCGKLLMVSSLLCCLTEVLRYRTSVNFTRVYDAVRNMVLCGGFKLVTCDIRLGSNILSNHETHKPCKNLLSMEAAAWTAPDHVVPVLQTNSCLPFLCSLSKFVDASDDHRLKLAFLRHENLQEYVFLIKATDKYNLTSNWFTKVESSLVLNVLKTSVSLQRDVDTAPFYEMAVKCLCIFSCEQKSDVVYLLRNIIFNKTYYPSETLLKSLAISEKNTLVGSCLNCLDDVYETYVELLGLRTGVLDFRDQLCVDVKIGNVIPVDWIYSPIVVLYSNDQKSKNTPEDKLIYIVTNCLRWIYIYEVYFAGLASMINSTDKFCRLACVFLASDDLFFVKDVRDLLEHNLRHLLDSSVGDLDFNRPVHGLTNFQDFYTQLLEQYQGVSYGDVLFSNFVLTPLMQKQDVKYRKLLWSEYAGVAQICNVAANQLLCPLEMFLNPVETDVSVLKCYRKCVVAKALRETSVLYTIAVYHLNNFSKR